MGLIAKAFLREIASGPDHPIGRHLILVASEV
jgi:hypothetical protein